MYTRYIKPLFNSRWSAILLFISVSIFLFVLPVMEPIVSWHYRLCMSFVLLFSVFSLEKIKPYLVLSGFGATLLYWFSDIGDNSAAVAVIMRLITYIFILWVLLSLMSKFMRQKDVGAYSLLEAVNGYLLLGIVLSSIVVMYVSNNPDAFKSAMGQMKYNDTVYYTLVTLTTTGYGDILPVSPGAKNLAVIIAVCGQIYVAFLVGVLVGKYTNRLIKME